MSRAVSLRMIQRARPLSVAILLTAACGATGAPVSTVGSGGGAGSVAASTSAASGGASSTSSGPAATGSVASGTTTSSSSSSGGAGGGGDDIPSGGTILFQEDFEDTSWKARGWYDSTSGVSDPSEHTSGTASFHCSFQNGGKTCPSPARHKLTPTETVYLRLHLKFSANWVGSGKPYHPHMFHFMTDQDPDFQGPSFSHLTTYTEVVNGEARLALQDGKNVDLACILKNDDSFMGCNGSFKNYPFSEGRSICSCNGLAGDLDGRDCYAIGDGTWYSSRSWKAPGAFLDVAGPRYKGDWHQVEIYFAMNSIANGVGVADGKMRWVQDGVTLISYDHILFRSGALATMKFAQFAMLPYIGDGSPVAQGFWVDDLLVATARP